MAPPDQCALAPDGTLLDAADITFYHDPDDATPIPQANSTTSSTPLHPFFRGGIIAGSRRSIRTTCPSARITDPDNVEALVATRKRSATVTVSAEVTQRVARQVKLTDSDEGTEHCHESDKGEINSEDEDDIATGGICTEEDGGGHPDDVEQVEEAYRATKAMGDTDRQVRLQFCATYVESNSFPSLQFLSERRKIERTADVRTIFKLDKNRVNPSMGKVEEGNWCTVCR
jgi:hypothetical protein